MNRLSLSAWLVALGLMASMAVAYEVPPHRVGGNNSNYSHGGMSYGEECRDDADCGELERCGNGVCLRSYHDPGDGPEPLPVTPDSPRPENPSGYICNSTVHCGYCANREERCEVVNCQDQVTASYTQRCD